MAENEPKKPEIAPEKPAVKPEQKNVQENPYDRNFIKQVDAKREEYEKKTEELKKRFFNNGSIGKDKVDLINARQINRLRVAADQKKNQFQALAASEKAERMALILGETEKAFIDIYFPYEKIIDYVKKMDKVDDADLVKIETLMDSMSKMKTNPVMEKLFFKLLNKEKIDPKEMALLADQITPMSIGQNLEKVDIHVLFESSQVGAVIGVMSEAQRLDLIEIIFKTKPLPQSSQILDTFLTAGIINNLQLQNLISRKVIPEPLATQMKLQMEKGDIAQKQQEYRQKLNKLKEINEGRNGENVVNKAFGSPALLAAAGIWGIATALINLKMSFDSSKPLESLANGLTSPYFLLGATAATVGVVGAVKIADPETYGKYREKFGDLMSGKEKIDAKQVSRKEELTAILETELSKNPFLMDFLTTTEPFPGGLKKTGLEVIQDIVKEKQAKKLPIDFDYKEIMDRSGPKQKEYLAKAYAALGSKDINFKDSLRAIMGTLTGLQLNTPTKLIALTTDFKKKQGLA